MPSSSGSSVADEAPSIGMVTDYDRKNAAVYARLLDAAEENAPWEEAASVILGIDPSRELDRARKAYNSHLARARWMIDQGYRGLLGNS